MEVEADAKAAATLQVKEQRKEADANELDAKFGAWFVSDLGASFADEMFEVVRSDVASRQSSGDVQRIVGLLKTIGASGATFDDEAKRAALRDAAAAAANANPPR